MANLNSRCSQEPTLRHTIAGSRLSSLFFSGFNKNVLHEGIRYTVFKQTGSIISRQDDTQLALIMRAVYLEYSWNDPSASVLGQVRCLNKRVLDFSVPQIVAEVNMHAYYLKDISSQPVPLALPVHSTQAGTRVIIRDTL